MTITTTKNQDGGMRYTLPDDSTFAMPPIDAADVQTEPAALFLALVDSLGAAAEKISAISGDADLSPTGKERKLEPITQGFVRNVGHSSVALDSYETSLDKREAALLAVPKLDPTHSAMAVEEKEIREWWRSLSAKARADMLNKIDKQPGHERLMLALMRSPIPQLDHEVAFVREVWNRTKRLDNPAESVAIAAGRETLEWARRGVANVVGLTHRITKLDQNAAVRALLTTADPDLPKGAKAFGVGPEGVEQLKRILAAEQSAPKRAA